MYSFHHDSRNLFEGWYFKHQKNGQTVAFIPGKSGSGDFVQVITNRSALHFEVKNLRVGHTLEAEGCSFGPGGVRLDLPGVKGALRYGPLTGLQSDIMGPFRHFPMECRHGVISMGHSLEGSLEIQGVVLNFDGGAGYIESDSGKSFPKEYLWVQCNDFPSHLSVMAAVAAIPFAGIHFTGCISAVAFGGREYRLATYRGARIVAAEPDRLILQQGKTLLRIDILERGSGSALKSPLMGSMAGIIKECNNATARFRLFERGLPVFDRFSRNVSFEYEMHPNKSPQRCKPAGSH